MNDKPETYRTNNSNELEDYFRWLCIRKDWILHPSSGTVGRAHCFYSDGEYTSAVNGEAVAGPVLELHNGHALLADKSKFTVLTKSQVEFVLAGQIALANVARELGAFAVSTRLPEELGVPIIAWLFREQARVITPACASEMME